MESVGKLLGQAPTLEQRKDICTTLLQVAFELSWSMEGDEFMRGWLDEAKHSIKDRAPTMTVRMPH